MENENVETNEFIVKHSTKDYITFFVLMVVAFVVAMYISSKLI